MGGLLAALGRSAPLPAGRELLRLQAPAGAFAEGSEVVACGSTPELGGWTPARAPPLRSLGDGEWALLEGDVAGGPPAEEALFKFVAVSPAGNPQWEEGRPNRPWPRTGQPVVLHWNQLEEFEGKRRTRPRRELPREAAKGEEVIIAWGKPDTPGASSASLAAGPSAIFHAFHWRWADIGERAGDIAEGGFDAVQLSPAQRSKEGEQWWARYQPLNYEEIHGLGDEAELRRASEACRSAGLRVIGDVVFNHMLVVASAEEWRRAQGDAELLEALKRRLEERVGPTFDREDFQWPWFELQGAEWDGPMRMEGWGQGEWSELKAGSPKVVAVHTKHLEILRAAGVSGFRLDAAKHMRPAHVADYAAVARGVPPASDSVFTFGEVLSFDASMQHEYMYARSDSCAAAAGPEEPFPTTDFGLAAWLRWFLEAPEKFLGERGSGGEPLRVEVPLLARNSVRFSRNHDNVEGSDDLLGLGSWDEGASAIAVAWLLSVHDGVVHVLAKDADACPVIREAARHRRAVRAKLASLGLLGSPGVWTDARARLAEGGGPPLTVGICVRSPPPGSRPLAFSVLNPDVSEGPPTSFRGSACLAGAGAGGPARFLSGAGGPAAETWVGADGLLSEALEVPPGGGLFFVAEE